MVATIDLEPGKSYRFRHKRKGEFVAKFLGLTATNPGDPDPYFVYVEIDTGEGSPWAWMANAAQYIKFPTMVDGVEKMVERKSTPPKTEKLLRPVLILGVAEV